MNAELNPSTAVCEHCEYENDGRVITAPGKFEGEPVWAPAMWDACLAGDFTEDDGETFLMETTACERARWPGLPERVSLWEDDAGFVRVTAGSR